MLYMGRAAGNFSYKIAKKRKHIVTADGRTGRRVDFRLPVMKP
jgi:hypothetical protein